MSEKLRELVFENNHDVYTLGAAMIDLNAIQFAVCRLMEDVDEGISRKYTEMPGMAELFVGEIEKKLRIIDMAFNTLNKELQSNVKKVERYSRELADIVVVKEEVAN